MCDMLSAVSQFLCVRGASRPEGDVVMLQHAVADLGACALMLHGWAKGTPKKM